jgi:hypothetical protein
MASSYSMPDKRLASPEEMLVELLRANEVLQLFEPCISSKLKDLMRHLDVLKNLQELLGTKERMALAFETRQLGLDFLE